MFEPFQYRRCRCATAAMTRHMAATDNVTGKSSHLSLYANIAVGITNIQIPNCQHILRQRRHHKRALRRYTSTLRTTINTNVSGTIIAVSVLSKVFMAPLCASAESDHRIKLFTTKAERPIVSHQRPSHFFHSSIYKMLFTLSPQFRPRPMAYPFPRHPRPLHLQPLPTAVSGGRCGAGHRR